MILGVLNGKYLSRDQSLTDPSAALEAKLTALGSWLMVDFGWNVTQQALHSWPLSVLIGSQLGMLHSLHNPLLRTQKKVPRHYDMRQQNHF
jgi:hypothetical protein